ncbi:MAG: acetate--CoA ligase family protein [Acidimicrobiales bacterium]
MNTHTLSEAASRRLVAQAGIPVSDFVTAPDVDGALAMASELERPLVAKLCGDTIAHKSERGLVRLGLETDEQVRVALTELRNAATADDGEVELLVSTMVDGRRELIAGLTHDPQFGMTVMLGIVGVLAEAIADVSFRLAPIDEVDAREMIDELATQKLLGAFRGEPPLDREAVIKVLVALGRLADDDPEIRSVDLNPLIIVDGQPVAVDALVERTGRPA